MHQQIQTPEPWCSGKEAARKFVRVFADGSVSIVHSFNSYTSKFKTIDLQATARERRSFLMKHYSNSRLQHAIACVIILKMGVIDQQAKHKTIQPSFAVVLWSKKPAGDGS